MILTYEALDSSGRRTNNSVEAADTKEAVEQLRGQGLFVTHIAEARPGQPRAARSSGMESLCLPSAWRGSNRLPLKTLLLFTRQVAMLLHAGSGVVPAISAIKRQMKRPGQAALLGSIITDLQEGATLTDALRRHPRTFGPVYCAIVAAGEASGTLAEMFDRLGAMVAKQRALRNRVIGALTYPALLVVMCVGILLSMLFFVLPRFNAMFVELGVNAPASTKLMLSTAQALTEHWAVALSTVAILGTLAGLMLASAPGRQWIIDVQISIPVLGRMKSRLIQGQVFRTMGTLLESGVGVLDTLDLVRDSTRNSHFRKLFSDLENAVTSGGRLSTTLEESGIVEPYACQAIHTGEDSGSPGAALTYCADMLDETNTEYINAAMKLIEPVILIGMGLVVGAVAISLFLPLFDMTSALR